MTPRRRARPAGEGREPPRSPGPRPPPRTGPCSPPPTCSLERAAEIQAANDADLAAAEAGGHGRRARSTACASPTPASRAWPTGCAPSPRCPIRSARCSTAGAAQRPRDHAHPRAARRGRDHLREPPQRHQRRGRAVREGRQRGAAPRGSSPRCARTSRSRRCCATRSAKHGLPEDAVILVEDTAYETATEVMQLTDYVDCLIPRGGPSLIQSIRDNATVPVIIDGDGNCHVYVDAAADLDEAAEDRRQRQDAAPERVQRGGVARRARGGRRRVRAARRRRRCTSTASSSSATPRAATRSAHIGRATDDDFGREFLDLKMSVAVAPDLDAAIAHVNRYGTGHTEAILTRDLDVGPPLHARGRRGRGRRERVARASPTARSSASAPRSVSRRRSCTRAARWACAS